MRLRYLETLASDNPEFPFQPGQVIIVDHLSALQEQWIHEGRIEVLEDVDENARDETNWETATKPRSKGRGR